MIRNSISGEEPGRSRDTVLFGLTVNLGIGNELGGGEFEYVGPAHNSDNKKLPPLKSSSKVISFLQAFPLIGIGLLLGVVFLSGFSLKLLDFIGVPKKLPLLKSSSKAISFLQAFPLIGIGFSLKL
uniref:Transmembrane protein n=1 Tax=Medicago truncatula TaxID=3880 RepID=I3T6Q4_MEDTR|nr:unknown [Medicago truncatula]